MIKIAQHVFDTFSEFKNWIVQQDLKILSNPNRGPILIPGQRISIADTKHIYTVIKHIINAEDILETDSRGGYLNRLKANQDFIFITSTQATVRTAIQDIQSNENLYINELLITQNSIVTLALGAQEENINKSSTLYVHNEPVSVYTNDFVVESWTTQGTRRYEKNQTILLDKNTSYLFILKDINLVHMIEISKSSFNLSQYIPQINEASRDKIPSEYAISSAIQQLMELLQKSIDENNSMIKYVGIDTDTNKISPINKNSVIETVSYAVRSREELPEPDNWDKYALVLKDSTSVEVYRAKTLVSPRYIDNPNYLGEGKYGTSVEDIENNISKEFPNSNRRSIVSNLDTNTEWEYNGIYWVETVRPAFDSKYIHNENYIGVYSIRKDKNAQNAALSMCFPCAKNGDIVNNTISGTEWEKTTNGWKDTRYKIGTTSRMPNPKIDGVFSWDSCDSVSVTAGLIYRYGKTLSEGDIISVEGGNDWIFYLKNGEPFWYDSGKVEGSSEYINNPEYLGTGNYGSNSTRCISNLQNYFPEAINNTTVGNKDTKTDWMFNGDYWIDTEQPVGTFSTVKNPSYRSKFVFNKHDTKEVSAILQAKFKNSSVGNIVYNLNTGTEWENSGSQWYDTNKSIHTTPQQIPDSRIIGTFNYGQEWIPPSVIIAQKCTKAKAGDTVYNLDTDTEWKFLATGEWVDTYLKSNSDCYLAIGRYGTNPPVDKYILAFLYKNAKEGQVIFNLVTNSYWKYTNNNWIEQKGIKFNKWNLDIGGSYEWELAGISPIFNGALFHVGYNNTHVCWFANKWNTIDLHSINTFNCNSNKELQTNYEKVTIVQGNQTISKDTNSLIIETYGTTTISFIKSDTTINTVKYITLKAIKDSKLIIQGAKWAYGLTEPIWGKEGSMMIISAHFIAGTVILSILDSIQE